MEVEKQYHELQRQRDDILTTFHSETRKFSLLEKRFAVLKQNHEELIKIKDYENRRENEKLRVENGCLIKENEGLFARLSVVKERYLQIHQLREEGKDLQNRFESAVASESYILIINNYLFIVNERPIWSD